MRKQRHFKPLQFWLGTLLLGLMVAGAGPACATVYNNGLATQSGTQKVGLLEVSAELQSGPGFYFPDSWGYFSSRHDATLVAYSGQMQISGSAYLFFNNDVVAASLWSMDTGTSGYDSIHRDLEDDYFIPGGTHNIQAGTVWSDPNTTIRAEETGTAAAFL